MKSLRTTIPVWSERAVQVGYKRLVDKPTPQDSHPWCRSSGHDTVLGATQTDLRGRPVGSGVEHKRRWPVLRRQPHPRVARRHPAARLRGPKRTRAAHVTGSSGPGRPLRAVSAPAT